MLSKFDQGTRYVPPVVWTDYVQKIVDETVIEGELTFYGEIACTPLNYIQSWGEHGVRIGLFWKISRIIDMTLFCLTNNWKCFKHNSF